MTTVSYEKVSIATNICQDLNLGNDYVYSVDKSAAYYLGRVTKFVRDSLDDMTIVTVTYLGYHRGVPANDVVLARTRI